MQILLDVLVNFVLNGVHCLFCRNKYVIFYIKVTDVYNFFCVHKTAWYLCVSRASLLILVTLPLSHSHDLYNCTNLLTIIKNSVINVSRIKKSK